MGDDVEKLMNIINLLKEVHTLMTEKYEAPSTESVDIDYEEA